MSPRRDRLNEHQVFLLRCGITVSLVGLWTGIGITDPVRSDQVVWSSLVLGSGLVCIMLLDKAKDPP